MNVISALVQVVPPPATPSEAATHQLWNAVEKDLGLTLPIDLFELSAAYGSGEFRGSNDRRFQLANPCSKWFRRHVKTWQPTYAELKANGVHAPFPDDLYPADPGMLCIGHGNGRIALFLPFRNRKPDGTVVALTSQEGWLQASSAFVPFFASVLRGEVDLFGLPGARDGGSWVFVPNNPADPMGSPSLLEAVLLEDADQIRLLVADGADLNTPSEDGSTPLCSTDDGPMVRLLLGLGADPNRADGHGRTPLTVACSSCLPVAELRALLEAGADSNQPDASGLTPLVLACSFRDVEAVRLLLRFGADPNQADRLGQTPLKKARKRPEIQAVLREAGAS